MNIKDCIFRYFFKDFNKEKLITISIFQLLIASFVLAGIVIGNVNSMEISTDNQISQFKYETKSLEYKPINENQKKYIFNIKTFTASAYDLSYECCGKYPTDDGYGITYSGKRAEKGRTIAVDPDVIPIGTKVFIKFPNDFSYMNGWYYAEDTGSLIKGHKVDIFFGDNAYEEAIEFGIRKVSILIPKLK